MDVTIQLILKMNKESATLYGGTFLLHELLHLFN